MADVIVLGAGIVGLATARELAQAGHSVKVIEKESGVAKHQTGRNSGVIHSGLYYAPGSQKAIMGTAGQKSMFAFAEERGVLHERTGKLVVATNERELAQLDKLAERAVLNGVPARKITAEEAREYEPYVRSLAALRVESTGIVDYKGICVELRKDIEAASGEMIFGASVLSGRNEGQKVVVSTNYGDYTADYVVNCTGLYSDKIAQSFGVDPEVQIVPFRGEYFELDHKLDYLVKGLIYPVPDPRFPFLGVHLTKMVAGGVHAGPNAVPALAREGYDWRTFNGKELLEAVKWPGFQKLALSNAIPGTQEIVRSFSTALFARSLSRLVPGIGKDDLIPAPAGVRAQALKRDGSLVDDFFMKTAERQLHVLNAPSPAATAALEIGKAIADRVATELKG
jgi:L-2-hydroxyglutarate oxidase